MPRVTWDRVKDIEERYDLIPAVRESSFKDFRPPTTIEDDFRRYLSHEVPNVVYTFEVVHDWYEAQSSGYSPIVLRAQQTPIDWKSKIGNSDMSTNFKVTHDVPINKGDIVIREDGKIYMLNWNIQVHPNNQATQNCECNGYVAFERNVHEVTDEYGMVIIPEHTEIIAPPIPIIHTEYAGRPDYQPSQWQPGVNADHLITVQVQYNSKTKNIRIDDTFKMDNYTYRVINMAFAEVHINNDYGILDLNCKRVAGGGIVAKE